VLNYNKIKFIEELNNFYKNPSNNSLFIPSSISDSNWIGGDFEILGALKSKLTFEEIKYLKDSPYIKGIYLDKKVNILMEDTAQIVSSLPLLSLLDSQNRTIAGEGITVAVIDTGVDYTHVDFGSCSYSDYSSGSCSKMVPGYNFVSGSVDAQDDHGHGTHVAGIIAANGSILGIAPKAKIMPIKVLNSNGGGSFSDIIAGIEFAMDPNSDGNYNDKVNIISMSLGGSGNSQDPISQASELAISNGIVVVVAAGNSGPSESTIKSPGVAKEVITVGATCKASQINKNEYCFRGETVASFSSRGPTIDGYLKPEIVAPGVLICSSKYSGVEHGQDCLDVDHVAFSGTSMATPVVSGVVALLLQNNPSLSPKDIKGLLMTTAKDLGDDQFVQGSGLINASAAINENIIIDNPTLNFGDITGILEVEKTIIIKNIGSSQINLSLNLSPFTDKDSNSYDIGSLNKSFLSINPNVSQNFSIKINTSSVGGLLTGKIFLNSNFENKTIPISLLKYANLNILLNDDVYDEIMDPTYVIIFDGNNSYEATEITYENYLFKLTPNNYSIYVIGETYYDEVKYLIMEDIDISNIANFSKNISMSLSREFNIQGKSFSGEDLDIYELGFGFLAYNNGSSFFLENMLEDFSLSGNQMVRISNSPKNIDNTDVIIKMEGANTN
ncbi:MAG: S8 family peptidase, partial [Nanoarchaeota archaeon]|nr:S8 family peptidase [Nanoarchaeota archaeon]